MNRGEKNVGAIDRVVRIMGGAAVPAIIALNRVTAPLPYPAAIIGIIACVTGATVTCPAFSPMGISTREKKG